MPDGSERTAGHGRENPPCPDRRYKKGQKSGAYRGFLDGRPAGGTGIIAARMIRRSPGPSPAETDRSPRKTPPESAFNATQGDAERELKAQYNRQAAYARRYSTNGRRPQHMNT